MTGVRFVVTVGIWLAALVGDMRPARGEKLAVGDVHGEVDVADEAGALTLLVRTALVGPDRTLLPPASQLRVSEPAVLAKLGADHALAMELSREGTGLRVTVVLVAAPGAPEPLAVALVRAGDGDLQALAKGIVDHVTTTLKLEPGRVPLGSLGGLRPFATAIRLQDRDTAAAAGALADVTTRTILPPAGEALRGLPDAAPTPVLAAIAGHGIGHLGKLDGLAAGSDGTAAAARAFAAIHRVDTTAADAALAKAPAKDGLVALAKLILAEKRADDKLLAARLADALATDQRRAALAVASTITPTRLAAPAHKALIALAAQPEATSAGVASRLGLAAAEQAIDVTAALALVSARELDEIDLARLERLLAKDDASATALRLRAELAMRRGDATAGAAIAAFLRAADGDARAHRYHGWQLMIERKYAEAAAAFAKAGPGARIERARALLAAGDPKAALDALEGMTDSPEGLVIQARVALAAGDAAEAAEKLALAELGAPANPLVHRMIIDLGKGKPDDLRAKLSRFVLEKGSTVQLDELPPAIVEERVAIGSGSAGGADAPVLKTYAVDARPLEPLVQALAELAQLGGAELVLAEQRWSPGVLAFRKTQSGLVRDGLAKLLQAPPYGIRISMAERALPDGALDGPRLASAMGRADAVLVYRVEPDGAAPSVSLTLHLRGRSDAARLSETIDMPGVVLWNKTKLTWVSVVGTTLVLALALWLGRSMGRVKIVLERTADVTDEVLCVLIDKSPTPPAIADEAEFIAATRKAGAISKPRAATLVASNHTFRIPTGAWYVHLYGVYARGGAYRKVPETATQQVELRRGDEKTLTFSLASKLAEVRIVIESEPRRGHAVWANDNEAGKVITNQAGEAVLMLPLGAHTITVEAGGHRLKRQLQIASIRIERVPFNVARELRFVGDADIAADDANHSVSAPLPVLGNVLDLDSGPVRMKPSVADGAARTLPVSSSALLLGRYRIDAELGRGAMGVVHRAWDTKLEREVAIKEMADDLRKNAEAMRLFTQEAKALAQLNHTNIVAMYDQVTDAERVYMIMEFVAGRPLEALLADRERLPWHEAVGLVDQILTGLAYAHARKVIHRDIKPANIFVTPDGVVKLGDFGLARVLREVSIRQTEIRGTPLYMAPEQITGTNVDHRSDLYAVGCTLFELVTGRPPYIDGDILYAQLHAAPPEASTMVAGLPPALDAIIARLIAKKADERFASANDVRAALRALG